MKRPLHGFTLVELLVVITIIGMLVGLLLPAVNNARESGRRATCMNNLHQLTTAIKSHATQFGFYPSGGWGATCGTIGCPNAGAGAKQPGGWIYQVLPFMDQSTLHDLGKGTPFSITSSASVTLVSTAIPVLYCPTRRAAQTYPGGGCGTGASYASRTDYVISGGSAYNQNYNPTNQKSPPATFNGIACGPSQVTDVMISDNKDTCYLVGEKYMAVNHYTDGQDPGDAYSAMSGDDVSQIRWGSTSLLPQMDVASTSAYPPTNPSLIFGSSHPAGWHAAFVGGNAQLIGWGIDGTLHQGMATRNGHEVIDPSKIPH